jgi:hypothetical protein
MWGADRLQRRGSRQPLVASHPEADHDQNDRPTVVALAPPTMQAVALATDDRDRGPLLVNRAGRRMTAYNVQYLVEARS